MKKHSALIILLVCVGFGSFAQQRLYFGAGPTVVGPIHGDVTLHDRVGYFIGVTSEAVLEGPFRYSCSLQFVKQHAEIVDVDLNVKAINASFYYGIEAFNDLNVLAGMQFGYIVDVEFDDAEVVGYNNEQFGWTAGLSYDVHEKLKVDARYMRAINVQIFDYTIQFGLHYKL